jgi:hypothetical protein
MFRRRRGLFGGSLGFIAFAHWPDVGGIGEDQLDGLTGCSFVWTKKEGSLHIAQCGVALRHHDHSMG